MTYRYAIAKDGVFDTIQGEGLLLGEPTVFVRLAGCSVGCDECDTTYAVSERLGTAEIVERLQRFPRRRWVWLTGGEPTDQPLGELVTAIKREGYSVALATAGVREVTRDGWRVAGCDFISVSPHFPPASDRWVLRRGTQLNVVAGLNGLSLVDFADFDPSSFDAAWVTPCDGKESLAECVEFVSRRDRWRLGVQAHKLWRLP